MERNTFGYSRNINDEVGIFIVCDDGALLNAVTQIMHKKGFVAVSDTAGRQHYIIDARINPMIAARKFEELLFTVDGRAIEIIGEKKGMVDELDIAIGQVLSAYKFDKTLYGTKLLARALRMFMVRDGATLKSIYSETGKILGMSCQQCERNIRYALQKSLLWEDGMKNYKAFMTLENDVTNLVY